MKSKLKGFPGWIVYLSVVFFLLLLVFSLFRCWLFLRIIGETWNIPDSVLNDALVSGIPYDVMTASYLLLLPALGFFFALFIGRDSVLFRRSITLYFSIVIFISLLACSADIPYYEFSGSRLNKAIAMWADTPGAMLGFVLGNPGYYSFMAVFVIGFFLCLWLFIYLQKKLLRDAFSEKIRFGKKIAVFLSVAALLLIGIRGGWRHRPVAIRDAFVSNFPVVNLLPLNPVHTFFDSMEKISLDYLEDEAAIQNARRYLNVKEDLGSPIARMVPASDSLYLNITGGKKPNIVLVLLESMSADMTGLSGSGISFTPELDGLSKNSISFSNFFTSGIHTCNGIYGALYSLPSVPGEHPLSNLHAVNGKFYGMAPVLKENGYSTHFFCTHNEAFDNMGFFLRNNGFDDFFSRKDYPDAPDEGSFGVSDETLYDFAFEKLNALSQKDKPFFASLLTISTHEPPVLPKNTSFKPKSSIPFEQVYEYADWALGNFMKRCSKEKWFGNTIFVFAADHGCNRPGPYEIPLSYHHSPLIIYAPSLIKAPGRVDKLAIQPDIFPTLMGLLNIPYLNNAMGVNLLSEERPFAYFCKDYLVGILNKEKFLIVRKFGGETLHAYRSRNPENILDQNRALAESMKTYAYSMLQTAQWMLEHKQLSGPETFQKGKK